MTLNDEICPPTELVSGGGQRSDTFFRLFQVSSDLMVVADPNGAFMQVNPACTRVLGYSTDELVSRPFIDFVHADDRQRTLDEMTEQLQRGFSLNFENRYLCKDGSVRVLEWRATFDEAEGITYATARDVTELRSAQAEREQFYKFFESSNDLMCIANSTGRFERVNRAWTEALGYSDEELREVPFTAFVHPDDVNATVEQYAAQSAGGYAMNFTNRFRRKDGSYCWLEWKATPLRGGFTYAIARDITSRRENEEKLRASERFVRSILDTVDEGLIVVDRDFRIVTANKAYSAQVGLAPHEIVGRHCYEVSHHCERPCFEAGEDCAVRQVFEHGGAGAALHRHALPGGEPIYVETRAFPLKDASGAVTSAIETISDVTERYLLEEERLKSQKLESIGTLAGGIAHDFNNLLQGVAGNISIAKLNLADQATCAESLDEAEQALRQSVGLAQQLLTFARGGRPVKKLTDVRPVLRNSTRFTLSGSRSTFRLELDDDLWPSEVDEGQLGQIVQNIVLNADQAMPGGGSVVVRASNVTSGLPAALPPGSYVRVTFTDTGIGIPDSIVRKIFDPYFTTKQRGSGLGLATSYSIARGHGGAITVKSTPGQGTTFSLWLPATPGVAPTAAEPSAPQAAPARRLRVLVMDDEEMLLRVCRRLLTSLQQDVELVRDGTDAVERYRAALAEGRRFDLVILDLTVRGGMGGAEAVKRLLEIDPTVVAVASSGYSDDETMAEHLARGFKTFLRKPFGAGDLRRLFALAAERGAGEPRS